VGDIRGFAEAVLEEVDVIEREEASGRPDAPRMESMRIARNLLAWRFSPEREAALLCAFVDRALDCMLCGPQV
jgi:predicted ATPase